jgi:hypothetical protein
MTEKENQVGYIRITLEQKFSPSDVNGEALQMGMK